jgi:hypothetical protein
MSKLFKRNSVDGWTLSLGGVEFFLWLDPIDKFWNPSVHIYRIDSVERVGVYLGYFNMSAPLYVRIPWY